ncbi:MAG TPA: hypothetical protein PKA41_20040 [Verrucomicrobiota bacterium]|nr:hypothetical protein [Verrucomicrobiota bacterium]
MKKMTTIIPTFGFLILALVFSGCKSTDSAKQGYGASVVIVGHTVEEIRRTAIEVFEWDGYTQATGLNFEKKGSKWDTAKYGGLSGNPVWIKISVEIVPQADASVIVGADAYVIEDRDSTFMNSERKLPYGKNDESRKILDQIKRRLTLSGGAPQ